MAFNSARGHACRLEVLELVIAQVSADRLTAHGQLSTATCHTPPQQRSSD